MKLPFKIKFHIHAIDDIFENTTCYYTDLKNIFFFLEREKMYSYLGESMDFGFAFDGNRFLPKDMDQLTFGTYRMEKTFAKNPPDFYSQAKTLIDANVPIFSSFDSYYLPHHPSYQKEHYTGHGYTITGYDFDEKVFWLADSHNSCRIPGIFPIPFSEMENMFIDPTSIYRKTFFVPRMQSQTSIHYKNYFFIKSLFVEIAHNDSFYFDFLLFPYLAIQRSWNYKFCASFPIESDNSYLEKLFWDLAQAYKKLTGIVRSHRPIEEVREFIKAQDLLAKEEKAEEGLNLLKYKSIPQPQEVSLPSSLPNQVNTDTTKDPVNLKYENQDISHWFTNKAIHDPGNMEADFFEGKSFIIDIPVNRRINTDKFYFKLPSGFDNIICTGQQISVAKENCLGLAFICVAFHGSYIEKITLLDETGSPVILDFALTDCAKRGILGEKDATPVLGTHNDNVFYFKHIWLKTLLFPKPIYLSSIILPENPSIRIFAISLISAPEY